MAEEFRGLLYAPSYEYELIMLFGMVLPYLKDYNYNFEIENYTDEFPDCFAKLNGEHVGIEFELNASKFKAHKHHLDPRLPNCGWIVCWKNDMGKDEYTFEQKETKQPVKIKIISLSAIIEDLKSKGLNFIYNPEKQNPSNVPSKWVRDTFLKQLKERVKDNEYTLIEELLEFCEKNKELEVVYGNGKIASFNVRVKRWGKISPLGAMANGVIWISFKDANKVWAYSHEVEAELRRRFNQPQTSYYKNYRARDLDMETLNKIKETLEWLSET